MQQPFPATAIATAAAGAASEAAAVGTGCRSCLGTGRRLGVAAAGGAAAGVAGLR